MSFQDMTRQHIHNPELRRTGGYRGIRVRKDFKPDIAAAVFAANPPELLKPIVTTQGVHLLRVEEIIRPELDQQLRLKIITDRVAKIDNFAICDCAARANYKNALASNRTLCSCAVA